MKIRRNTELHGSIYICLFKWIETFMGQMQCRTITVRAKYLDDTKMFFLCDFR
jgi:hypothetical protein